MVKIMYVIARERHLRQHASAGVATEAIPSELGDCFPKVAMT